MKPPEVVIVVEHLARELSLSTLIKRIAWRRYGIRVEVRSLLQGPASWPSDWQPRIICVPYLYSATDFGIGEILAAHPASRMINLAYEQHLSRANQRFKRPRDEFARDRVLHIASGSDFSGYLQGHGVPGNGVVRLGSLTCALYRAPYRVRFEGQRERLAKTNDLSLDKTWLLVPENFAAAFFSRSHCRHRLKQGFTKDDLHDYVQSSRECFQHSMGWLAELAAEGKCEVILRPRPAVNEAYFLRRVRKSLRGRLPEGMRIVKSGDVRGWVCASDAIASNISSTLVEAVAAGKPIGMLQPQPLPRSVETEWNAYAPRIRSYRELRCLVDLGTAAHHGNPVGADGALDQSRIRNWVAKEMLGSGDPIDRCVELLHRLLQSGSVSSENTRVSEAEQDTKICVPGPPVNRSLWNRIRKHFPRFRSRAFGHEQDHLTDERVENETSAWAAMLNETERDAEAPAIESAA